MISLAAAAAIAGAASLIGGGVASYFNYKNQQSANETNISLARENRDYMYQQWNRENAYNNPSAAMQRLAGAGLNSNLMYGEGAGGLPASASMQGVDTPRVSAPQVDPLVLAQAANLVADTELKKGQKEKTESDIRVNEGVIKVNDSVVMYNQALTSYTKSQQDKVIADMDFLGKMSEDLDSQIALRSAQMQNMSVQQKIAWIEVGLKSKETDAICEKYASETALNAEQLKYTAALMVARINNLNADSELKRLQGNLTAEQIEQCQQVTANMYWTGKSLEFQYNQDLKYNDVERRLKQDQCISEIIQAVYGHDLISTYSSVPRTQAWNDYKNSLQ